MKYLVDANVLSEPTKPAPQRSVFQWLRDHELELVVNPIVLGELEHGILLLPVGKRRARLQQWFQQGLATFRVLDLDAKVASTWAQLLAGLRKRGLAMPVKDSLIAATALAHGLTVVTRNVIDFRATGVAVVNPFEN